MTLSEAIRLGSMLKAQSYGGMLFAGRTCALGAAMDAIGRWSGFEDTAPGWFESESYDVLCATWPIAKRPTLHPLGDDGGDRPPRPDPPPPVPPPISEGGGLTLRIENDFLAISSLIDQAHADTERIRKLYDGLRAIAGKHFGQVVAMYDSDSLPERLDQEISYLKERAGITSSTPENRCGQCWTLRWDDPRPCRNCERLAR